MSEAYLEVTYRDGKPFAAYLYLPRRAGAKAERTDQLGKGMLVDYDGEGVPMGVEITAPQLVTAEDINRVLDQLGLPRLRPEELAPLRAA